ncbi:MAG: ligand-binding sensor domain-containing protein [Terriglobales bacterium]
MLWEASRVLRQAREQVAVETDVPFTAVLLDRPLPAGVEWISAPAVFTGAAQFQGNLYLYGPTGLSAYSPEGALLARYRAGLELPPAPVVAAAVGLLPDSSQPELFLATAGEGLVAFDGRRFRQLRPENPEYRRLTALLPLSSGRLLLGTEKHGVLVYDGKHLTAFHPALTDLHVTALAGDSSSLWVGTLDRGLLHWSAGEVHAFGEAEGLPDRQVLSVAADSNAAYAGTPVGVAEVRDNHVARSLAPGFFARALLLRGQTLVVGTLEEGIVAVPLAGRPPRAPRPRSQPFAAAVEQLLELEGKLYAVAGDGLYSAAGPDASWRRVLESQSGVLTDHNISALAVDPAGRLWVGYFDRGLDILDAGATRPAHLEDSHLFCVNRIVFRGDGRGAAVATANGLVLFDSSGRPQQVLGRADGLIADHVTDVAFSPQGMAVATPAGLTFLDASGARSLYAFHGLVNNHAYALGVSGDRLMVGTLGGLSVLSGGVVRASYTTSNSHLTHNWISAIAPVGEEWFAGTYGGGVLRLDSSGEWQAFPDLPADLVVNPNAMLVTEARVYVGTLDRGLLAYDRSSRRWSNWTSGLPSVNVTALASSRGYLYVGTDNGLVRLSEQSLP